VHVAAQADGLEVLLEGGIGGFHGELRGAAMRAETLALTHGGVAAVARLIHDLTLSHADVERNRGDGCTAGGAGAEIGNQSLAPELSSRPSGSCNSTRENFAPWEVDLKVTMC
jgi:hypothetical protein